MLIIAGGMVTSTGSGLAVPDWPTTYGYFMFSFPFSKMVGGILYEHGHRMIASTVGLLTIVLTIWLWRTESRRWVRWLGALALLTIVLQGLLGGLTVLFLLPAPISIGHAGLAQMFFGLTVSLALVTSPGWRRGYGATSGPRLSSVSERVDSVLRRLTLATTGLIYVQILVGAAMRHTGAGLAIPDFPLAFGGILPPRWDGPIAIHFAHRAGAAIVALAVFVTSGYIWRERRQELSRPAMLLLALVLVQIALGGFVVLSQKAVDVNTAHVATGALLLATALVLTLRAHRPLFSEHAAPLLPARDEPSLVGAGSSFEARA